MDQVVEDLLSCLDDPALALLQWKEAFGVVQVPSLPCIALARAWVVHRIPPLASLCFLAALERQLQVDARTISCCCLHD